MILSSSKLPKIVECPTSKSYAARALVLASLVERPIQLNDLPQAQDTVDLINALIGIGVEITNGQVINSFPACETYKKRTLNVGEGGTTARFLLPLLALGSATYELIYDGKLNQRPFEPMYKALRELGVEVTELEYGLKIKGPIKKDLKVDLDCTFSSQFASAFTHLNIIGIDCVHLKKLNTSKVYHLMSQSLVEVFKHTDNYTIPADYSGLGYFISYAILNQELTIANVMQEDPLQADNYIFKVMDRLQVDYSFTSEGLRVRPGIKSADNFRIDARICLDLIPTLIFLFSYLPLESEFIHLENLRLKESDRLNGMLDLLKQFKVKMNYNSDKNRLKINGQSTTSIAREKVTTQPDHRMIMVASLFIKQNGGGEIWPSENVAKSFPSFFNYFT